MLYQLAQVNIARMRAKPADQTMRGLISRVDEINRLAEMSDGFVWRLPGADAPSEALHGVADYLGDVEPDQVFYNLSIWDNMEHLRQYIYKTCHKEMLQGKHQWIEAADNSKAAIAFWWIPAGHRPTIAESLEKLRSVNDNGPAEAAFTLAKTFPPPDRSAE